MLMLRLLTLCEVIEDSSGGSSNFQPVHFVLQINENRE